MTIKTLENKIEELNIITKSPLTPLEIVDNKLVFNKGCYHLYRAYGAFIVHQICNESGGARDVTKYGTKRETAHAVDELISSHN